MELTAYIKDLCKKGESTEVEFKSAAGGFPGSFWETYSAFGNTNGGFIVLGIKEKNQKFRLDKLTEEQILKYKKQYWDDVHNRNKANTCLTMDSDVFEENYGGSHILVFRIPRAQYSKKPIYIGPNPLEGTYVRRHEGDYKLEPDAVRRMFADADVLTHPLDGKILKNLSLEKDFDTTTIRQYRQLHNNAHAGHPWSELSDLDFFKKIGGYKSDPDTGEEVSHWLLSLCLDLSRPSYASCHIITWISEKSSARIRQSVGLIESTRMAHGRRTYTSSTAEFT